MPDIRRLDAQGSVAVFRQPPQPALFGRAKLGIKSEYLFTIDLTVVGICDVMVLFSPKTGRVDVRFLLPYLPAKYPDHMLVAEPGRVAGDAPPGSLLDPDLSSALKTVVYKLPTVKQGVVFRDLPASVVGHDPFLDKTKAEGGLGFVHVPQFDYLKPVPFYPPVSNAGVTRVVFNPTFFLVAGGPSLPKGRYLSPSLSVSGKLLFSLYPQSPFTLMSDPVRFNPSGASWKPGDGPDLFSFKGFAGAPMRLFPFVDASPSGLVDFVTEDYIPTVDLDSGAFPLLADEEVPKDFLAGLPGGLENGFVLRLRNDLAVQSSKIGSVAFAPHHYVQSDFAIDVHGIWPTPGCDSFSWPFCEDDADG